MEIKLNITQEEHKELVAYCNLNDLLISSVVKDSFKKGFNIERYGLLNSKQEKVIEKEIIKEKIIEIPVEIIKEVVKIEYVEVEKPVEIIKEIPVEVIKQVVVETTSGDNSQPKIEALQKTLQKLKQENIEKDQKIQELEKKILNLQSLQQDKKAMYLRGSNLNDKF